MGELRVGFRQVAGAGDGQSALDAFDGGGASRFGESISLRFVPGRIDLRDSRGVRCGRIALPAIGAVSHHPYSTPPVLRPVFEYDYDLSPAATVELTRA